MDVKLKVFTKDGNKNVRLVANLIMGEAEFTLFMRLWNLLVIAAESFDREENLCPAVIPTMSKDMDEQLKLSRKVVEVVERAN